MAETTVSKALSLAPNHALAHVILGVVKIFTKRVAQGIADCEQALALDRNLAGAHALIGYAKVLLGRGADTEAHINEALRLSPRDTGAFRWFVWGGIAKAQLEANAETVVWLRRGLKRTGTIPSRISISRLRWRGSGSRTKRGLLCKQDLRSIRASPFAGFVRPPMHGPTIRRTVPDANASLRGCAWPGCRRAKVGSLSPGATNGP